MLPRASACENRGLRRLLVLAALPLAVLVDLACGDYGAADEASDDAGQSNEAGAEAASDAAADVGGDAGPSTFCATKPAAAWCEDFDTLTDVAALVPEHSAGALPALLTQKSFASPPRSLRFVTEPGADAAQFTVVSRSFVTDKDVRLEVDWRWTAAEESAGQTLQSITVKRGAPQASFGRSCGAGEGGITCRWFIATCAGDRVPACQITDIPPPAALAKWSRVALQVHFGVPNRVIFEEDGNVLVDAKDDMPLMASEPTSATIGLAVLQGTTSAFETFYDNVVVELK